MISQEATKIIPAACVSISAFYEHNGVKRENFFNKKTDP
jgi:hypothetical protein